MAGRGQRCGRPLSQIGAVWQRLPLKGRRLAVGTWWSGQHVRATTRALHEHYDFDGASEPIPCGVFIVVQVPVGTFL